MGEDRIPWEQHAIPMACAVVALCFAIWAFPVMPDVVRVLTPLSQCLIGRLTVVAVPLSIIWIIQSCSIFQTRRWVMRETRKRFNFRYVILTAAILSLSILTCLSMYCAARSGCIITHLPALLLATLFVLTSICPIASEVFRRFAPLELSKKDPFALPGDFPLPYIERDWNFEWMLLLKAASLLPMLAIMWMYKTGLRFFSKCTFALWVPIYLMPAWPSRTVWRIDKQKINYHRFAGWLARSPIEKEWWMTTINFIDVIDFDPATDFTGDVPRQGKGEVFEGVDGYFNEKCRRGVIIGTKDGKFYLLGFARPNYAATVIMRFVRTD